MRAEWLRYFTNWTWVAFGATSLLGVGIVIHAMVEREGQAASNVISAGPVGGLEGPRACAPGSSPRRTDVEGADVGAACAETAEAAAGRWNVCRRAHLVLFELTATSSLFLTVFYYAALVHIQKRELLSLILPFFPFSFSSFF